ncbi:MAG: CDP-glucose 4,6-dehydratase [Caulobacteraceae bacterium]
MSEGGGRRPDPAFWNGKRVLLTGHTGFKGSWAAVWLHRMGALATGLALAPDQTPSLFELAGVGELIESHILDVRDRAAVADLVGSRDWDLVIHMAAQPIVRASVEDPVGTFGANVMGVAHLLDALRGQRPQAVLVVTSDKVYANEETARAFAEADALGGKDPYSASKAAAEIVTASYARTFFARSGVPVATGRAGNVIGGGDFSRDRLISDIVRAARAGTALELRHPEATRPWQHVLDCVAGYLVYAETLAQDPAAPRAVNFGPAEGAPVTVGALADTALKAFGVDRPWRHTPDPASVEARHLSIDTTLARRALGFSSRLDGGQAVAMTMDWYRDQARGADPRRLTLDQIALYESLP